MYTFLLPLRFCSISLFFVLFHPGLLAAETDAMSIVELEAFEVSAERGSSTLTMPGLDEARELIMLTPGGVDILDANAYMRFRASTLNDVLAFSPGVFAQSRFGSDESRLSIRGSGLQRTFHGRGVMVLQDGVPVNLADGGFDFQIIEPNAARYIEVFRGANALQYGSSTLGGAINFVSPTGYDSPAAMLRAEAGSFNYFRGSASAAGVQGPVDYYASFSPAYLGGYRDHSKQNNQRFLGNLGWRVNDELETRFYLAVANSDSQLPGNLTKARAESDPRAANPASVIGNYKRDLSLIRLSNRTVWVAGDALFEAGAFISHKDLDHPIFQVIDQNSNDYGVTARTTVFHRLAGFENRLRAGIGLTQGVTANNRFVNVMGQRGAPTVEQDQTATNLELFAENRTRLNERLTLVLGIQTAFNWRKQVDKFNPNASFARRYTGVSPKVGLIYQETEAWQWFGNVSRSYEPPSFGELNTPLSAQRGTTLEVGTRGQAGPVRWDLAYYYTWLNGEFLSLNDAAGNPLGTVNANKTIHQGVEAGLEVDLLSWIMGESRSDALKLRQTFTWGDFRFDNDPVYGNNQLAGLPAFYYRAALLYEHGSGWYAGPDVEWVPSGYPIDFANTFYTNPYAILGFILGYRTDQGWSFYIQGKNILNTRYVATTGVIADARGLDSPQFLPGDGAAVYLGLEYRW